MEAQSFTFLGRVARANHRCVLRRQSWPAITIFATCRCNRTWQIRCAAALDALRRDSERLAAEVLLLIRQVASPHGDRKLHSHGECFAINYIIGWCRVLVSSDLCCWKLPQSFLLSQACRRGYLFDQIAAGQAGLVSTDIISLT